MSAPVEYRDPERRDLASGSKMFMVVECEGQPNLERSLPPEAFQVKDEKLDEMADRGTRIHRARETGNTLDLDADEVEIYNQGLKYEDQIVQNWMRDKGLTGCEEGPRELRVWLHDPINFPELLGSVQLDTHFYNRKRGCVLSVDWKSGWNPNLPPSPHSWQLRFGAVALHQEEYPDWMKECRVAYCKAQQKHTVNDYCDYSQSDLELSWQALRLHLWKSAQPDAPRRAGAHCNFCRCKPYCIEAGAYSLIPTVAAKRVPQANEMTWEAMVQTMQPQDLLKVYEVSAITEKIIKAVKARLKAMPGEELAKLGLELGEGRKLDPIVDVAGAYDFLVREFGDQEAILKCMSIGKTDLVELVRTRKGKTKDDASQWVSTYLDRYIERARSEAPLRKIKG